jgi:hypothetical protein
MLRINLLPPYIYEGAKRRNVTVLWVVILLLVIGGFVYAKTTIDSQTADLRRQEQETQPKATEALNMASEAGRIKSDSQVIVGKANFVRNAVSHDRSVYQELLTNVARYTWPKVMYDGIRPEAQSVTLPAYAPTLRDVGHYMIYMERNPKISRVDVAINSIPSFPSGGQQGGGNQSQATGVRPLSGGGHNFTAVLTLRQALPNPPGYAGAAGGNTGQTTTGGGRTGGPGMGGPGLSGPGMGGPGLSGPGMGSGGGGGMSGGR